MIYFPYQDGKLEQKSNFKDDKLDGEYKYYFPDGIQIITGSYLNGKKNGVWTTRYANGKQQREIYNDDREIEK